MLGSLFCPVSDATYLEPEEGEAPTANFRDGNNCLQRLRLYEGLMRAARAALEKWDIEPAAAALFEKETQAAEDLARDVWLKMSNVMKVRGMSDAQIDDYFKRNGAWGRPLTLMPEVFSSRVSQTAREIADDALWVR
jgi:hypothetical protein